MIQTGCISQGNHQTGAHLVQYVSFIGDTVRPSSQDCSEPTQTNKQASRQRDSLPCVNVGYHCGPPSFSPQRTLAGPDKLDLAAPRALRGKTVLMLATVELIGAYSLCYVTEHKLHSDKGYTAGLVRPHEAQAGSREGQQSARVWCQRRLMLCSTS